MTHLARRRCLTILAASAAGLALPAGAGAAVPAQRWSGMALGAPAALVVRHDDAARSTRLIEAAVAEIRRLERIFSLFDPSSALARLNGTGRLDDPPFELVDLLHQARAVHDATGGAFDPTVQPLWRRHAEAAAAGRAPDPEALRAARAAVGMEAVAVDTHEIAFGRPGMALTLNGIAQGYVTDRIADLLRAGGLAHVLVDLGEIRATGERSPGEPWRIGLGTAEEIVPVTDGAVATSATFGTVMDAAGGIGHIIDPRLGRPSPGNWRRVSVLHPRATIADGLSTGFVLLDRTAIDRALEAFPPARAITTA
jgi:thiamine biosynthesis lipoprotein